MNSCPAALRAEKNTVPRAGTLGAKPRRYLLAFPDRKLISSSVQFRPAGRLRGASRAKGRPMSLQLPVPIERYVQIANSGTPEGVPECFAPDAIVRDEGQTYEGVAAIKNWMAATKKKYGHTITP